MFHVVHIMYKKNVVLRIQHQSWGLIVLPILLQPAVLVIGPLLGIAVLHILIVHIKVEWYVLRAQAVLKLFVTHIIAALNVQHIKITTTQFVQDMELVQIALHILHAPKPVVHNTEHVKCVVLTDSKINVLHIHPVPFVHSIINVIIAMDTAMGQTQVVDVLHILQQIVLVKITTK